MKKLGYPLFQKCHPTAYYRKPYLQYSNPLKYTSLRAAEKIVHFEFVYIGIEYT